MARTIAGFRSLNSPIGTGARATAFAAFPCFRFCSARAVRENCRILPTSRAAGSLTRGPIRWRRCSRKFVATNKPTNGGPRPLQLFFYSTGNIAGCLLAMGGLGLFFGGIIHAYWWAIVAGLYGVGALGWPRSDLAGTAQRTELSTEHLAQQVRKLVDSVAHGLPKDALEILHSIQGTLSELLPRLQELRERGVISAKDSFTVVETVRRYLPDTLAEYLRLPRFYAQMQTLADGRTASQTLLDQLQVLDSSLKEVAKSAFAGDAETLVSNGQFLLAKFSEKIAFTP